MDFQFTEEQIALRDNVRKMMDRIATPEYIRRVDQERTFPYELTQAWAEMGLYGVAFPEEYGGFGGTIIDMMIISEEIARKSYDFVGAYNGVLF